MAPSKQTTKKAPAKSQTNKTPKTSLLKTVTSRTSLRANAKADNSRGSSVNTSRASSPPTSASSRVPSRKASVSDEEDDTPSHAGNVLDPSGDITMTVDNESREDEDIEEVEEDEESELSKLDISV
jgi:hypothetical protein